MNLKTFLKPMKYKIILAVLVSVIVEYFFYSILTYCPPCPYEIETGTVCSNCPPITPITFILIYFPVLIFSYVITCTAMHLIKKIKK